MTCKSRARWPAFGVMPLLWLAGVFAVLTATTVAIDYTRRAASHAALEDAAAVAAHAALTTRLMLDESAARSAARAVIRRHAAGREDWLHGGSIEFGRWDAEARRFIIEPDARDAVRVIARGEGPARPVLEPLFQRLTGQRGFGRSASIVLVADPLHCAVAPVCPAGTPRLAALSAR